MLSLPHGRLLLALGWVLVVLTVVGSLAPPSITPAGLIPSDKVLHFLGYFAMTLWFAGLYPRERLWVVAVSFFALGGALELLQGLLTATRERDLVDLFANSLGIAAAIVVAALGLSSWALRLEAWLTRRTLSKAAAGKESA